MKTILEFFLLGVLSTGQILLVFSVFGLLLFPFVLYLITLQKTLNEISIENRKMPPDQVWLTFIPLFGLVWQFIMVNRISDSLKAEFFNRKIKIDVKNPGKDIGLAYCVLLCCSVIPTIRSLAIIGGLICWIIYWAKINNYKNKLQQSSINNINV